MTELDENIQILKNNENNQKIDYIKNISIQLYILDAKNNYQCIIFKVNNKLWNYLITLTSNLDTQKFKGFFKKTMSMYLLFKSNSITDQKDVSDYFRRCQFLSLLQMMCMINNSLPQFSNTTGLIKIGPSKNGKKNCCIIDDSTILDKENNEIRDTNGTINEPHRGHRLFYQLSFKQREDVILVFNNMIISLKNILHRINYGHYYIFDPIYILQRIVYYCSTHNLINFIDYLSWEIHDTPYLLTNEEKINLFKDYDSLYSKWHNNFITDNHGKLRIFILCLYYIELVNTKKINELF
jgi:hypothetical protein